MRFLANENFPRSAVELLRSRGHDVAWVRTDSPGMEDHLVLRRAVDEGRILLTFDKGFGELAFRSGLPASSGVVLFRFERPSSAYIAKRALEVLESRSDWAGCFSVLEENSIRMTALPSQ